MSFGKSKSKQQSSSETHLDPTISQGLLSNAANAQGQFGAYTPYTGQRVADFNPTQVQGQQGLLNISSGQVGAGTLGAATGAATGAAAYTPGQVNAQQITPQQITAGQIANTNLDPYLNPWTQDVVDTSNADISRQRDIALNQSKQKALAAGAWGGTGAGVMQGQVADDYARAQASTTAQLRSQGYTNAQGAAGQDIAGRLTADQANQNAGLLAGQSNQSATLSADQGNQQAGLAANQQHLAASGLLADQSNQELSQATARAGLVNQVGDTQQAQQQKVLDAAQQAFADYQAGKLSYQDMLNKTYGLLGNPVLGTTQSTGQSTTTNITGPKQG